MTAMRRASEPEINRLLSRMATDGILLAPDAILDAVEHPCWERPRRGCDWRTYIPPSVRSQWDLLPLVTRLCVFATAELIALEEDPGTTMVTGSAG
jgi:hypothetical protein